MKNFIYTQIMLVALTSFFNNIESGQEINLALLENKKNILPVAVIGSGPAGLNAAIYTARSAFYTVVFQGKSPGGQLTTTSYVENWPGIKKTLGFDIMEENREQAINSGVIISTESIVKVDFSVWPRKIYTEDGEEILAAAVILATGANSILLGVPGEREFFGLGVTVCALCDAPFFRDKKVVVVGGGDSAVEDASLLEPYVSELTMLVRGPKMRAVPSMQNRITNSKKINVLYNTKITEILGANKTVTGVKLENTKDKTEYIMTTDGVFLAIGHMPNSSMFKEYLELTPDGYIKLNKRTQETGLPGITAAGDVSDHMYKQAGIAAGDGGKAGIDIVHFLQNLGLNQENAKKLEPNYYKPE